MADNTKAEELAKEKANEYAIQQNDCWSNDFDGFYYGFLSRQSEIDELTKEVERLRNEVQSIHEDNAGADI